MDVYSSRRVAKNTFMLYLRMLLNMAISLYTSRIVLNVLGVEDYGIYNVVGGFVVLLGVLNNAMATATQRYLSFNMVGDRAANLSRVFLMSINIHLLIGIFVFLFAELLGAYLLNSYMSFPEERMSSVNLVFHFSVAVFFINVVSVPFNALIIARERMSVFAAVSILEGLLKLFMVIALQRIGGDKLVIYSLLMLVITFFIKLAFATYCLVSFPESKFKWFWDSKLFKELFTYAGWNFWGNLAGVLSNQGVNVLLNVFFGPVVNAARGVAFEVRAAINALVYNFQLAISPQIIKTYANGDRAMMLKLVFQGAKLSFFLLFFFSLPLFLESDIVLKLWLKIVPDYSVDFVRLVLVNLLIDCLSGPLMATAQATGRIRLYQVVVGGSLLAILPISYLFLQYGYDPQVTFYVSIFFSLTALFFRLIVVRVLVGLRIRDFLTKVIFPIVSFSLLSVIIPSVLNRGMDSGLFRTGIVIVSSFCCTIISFFLIGLTKEERTGVLKYMSSFIN